MPYEETFVGRLAHAFPDLYVLNAAVESYSPSIYYEKLKQLIDVGLRFDKAIIYIDISDIPDEAIVYSYDEHGILQLKATGELSLTPRKKAWQRAFYVADFLNQVRLSQKLARKFDPQVFKHYTRASWTYDANASGYGSMGVEGGTQRAKQQIDRLYLILSRHGVALSVGVYPWSKQLLYDSKNSRQVTIWREWCAERCKRFFDHFPAFFRYKEKDPDFIRNLFILQDVH